MIRNAPLAVVKAVSQEGAPFVAIGMPNQEMLYRLVSTEDKPVDDLASTRRQDGRHGDTRRQRRGHLRARAEGRRASTRTPVTRVAVGNDAAALAFVEDGRVDALFATLESTATMKDERSEPAHRRARRRQPPARHRDRHDAAEGRPKSGTRSSRTCGSVDQSMRAVMDPEQLDALIPKVADQFDVPGWTTPSRQGGRRRDRQLVDRGRRGEPAAERSGAVGRGRHPVREAEDRQGRQRPDELLHERSARRSDVVVVVGPVSITMGRGAGTAAKAP